VSHAFVTSPRVRGRAGPRSDMGRDERGAERGTRGGAGNPAARWRGVDNFSRRILPRTGFDGIGGRR
jgi:hypothetical protein